jgi:hypothetical protein
MNNSNEALYDDATTSVDKTKQHQQKEINKRFIKQRKQLA